MKILYNWLESIVNVGQDPQKVADVLTMAGVAVDTITPVNRGLVGAKTGKIVSVEPHPNANKLLVCQMDMGDEKLTIVTGADNVSVGQVVPTAVPGSKLPGGVSIETVDFRGLQSQGMLLSPDEMNIDKKTVPLEMREGILILPESTPLGKDVAEVLELNDYVLELDLTPNRADCLSVMGVARDMAALFGTTVIEPRIKDIDVSSVVPSTHELSVEIRDRDLCGGYVGLILEQVQVQTSPLWLQNRLRNMGVRPINNIVDLTNLVMLETGQPLHAFDYESLQEHKIVVRRSVAGESLVTLDGEERALPTGTLVIADSQVPVAIAGIMGSLHSEVGTQTKKIVVESALFDLVSIRRSSKALALRTDASARFDKGVDPAGIMYAIRRLAHLVEELGCATVVKSVAGEIPHYEEKRDIEVRVDRINSLLGLSLSDSEVSAILGKLGFTVRNTLQSLIVSVPSRRRDVVAEVDIVEEVGRIYGMFNIPTLPMSGQLSQGSLTPPQLLRRQMRRKLVGLGLNEVFSLSFHSPSFSTAVGLPDDHPWSKPIPVLNPLSRDRGALRPSLVPGILGILQHNQARQADGMACFEIGAAFVATELPLVTQPREELKLCLGAFGVLPGNWTSPDSAVDFYYVKGIIDVILEGNVEYRVSNMPFLHPGRQAEILVMGTPVGFLGELNPKALVSLGLRDRVVIAELDFYKSFGEGPLVPRFHKIPASMAVKRDMAFVLPVGVEASAIVKVIRQAGGSMLSRVDVFDVYAGQNLPEGKRSLAFRLEFANLEATLTETELTSITGIITAQVEASFGAQLRR